MRNIVPEKFFLDEVCLDLQNRLPDWQFRRQENHIQVRVNGGHIANVNVHLRVGTMVVLKLVPNHFKDTGAWTIEHVAAVELADPAMVEKVVKFLLQVNDAYCTTNLAGSWYNP